MSFSDRFGCAALVAVLACGCAANALAQSSSIETSPFAGPSGPQQANDEGRTELPMVVRRSIAFREIGPAISGGRVTAVAGVPGKPGVYFVGAADGGIFRTEDGGTTWKALFQHEAVASIGALAVDPVNPGVIWAGTGEANVRNDVSFGDGIYKSTDNGNHWKRMGLEHSFQISRIVIDPHHPGTVWVAAMGSPWTDSEDRGIYRTTDGGTTWQKVLYAGPSVGMADLAMNPDNPQVLLAAAYRFRRTPWSYSDGGPEDAIYKSIDGGTTWRRLSGHGLPEQPVTRIGLAIAPSDPNVVYGVMGSNEGVLWRSHDAGEHWTLVSRDEEVDVRPFYFSHLAVDPENPDHVLALSNNLMESKDGGHTFTAIAKQIHGDHHTIWIDPSGSGRIIEGNDGGVAMSADNAGHWAFVHNLAIGQFYHVSVAGCPFYTVCGGLQDNSAWCGTGRSKDPSGILDRAWFALNGGDGMFAIQAADNPNLFYNSTQNGVWMTFDRGSQQVHDMEPYPRDISGGGVADLPYRFAWNAGFAVSPQNPQVLYAGGNVLFRSEDRGRTWKPISGDLTRNDKEKLQSSGGPVMKDNSGAEVYDAILSIAPARKDPKVIWVGTDDGLVQVTRDGGTTWKNVTANLPHLPEWGRVESIDVAPENPGEAVIAVDRHFSGDFTPYLFRTTDYGATWTSLVGDLPAQAYAHVVRRDLHNPRMYYAGLENGLYVSWDAGQHWYLFGLGLPNASVYDVALDAEQNALVVGTHGRSVWILDDLTPFQQFTPQMATETAHLFAAPAAVRFWPWSQVEPLGDGAFYGKNPPAGATISYFVAHEEKDPGQLVITDAQGHVVRTMKGTRTLEEDEVPPNEEDLPPAAGTSSKPQGEQQEARPAESAKSSQAQQQPTPAASHENATAPKEVPWVPARAGLQRLTWDLRADGPVRWEAGKQFLKGPRSGAVVPPGNYNVALTIGGKTLKEQLAVVSDPDSHADNAAMEERFHDTETILHEISQLDVALNRISAIEAQLGALRVVVKGTAEEKDVTTAIDTLVKQMKAAEAAITSNPGAAESTLRVPDQVHEHLLALEAGFEGEDDAPTAAMVDQMKLLQPQYEAALARFNNFLKTDLPTFNRTMEEHKLTGVVPGDAVAP
ncbi:MAG: VPS10 domain-containing protein [Acidobacteriota bacterium]